MAIEQKIEDILNDFGLSFTDDLRQELIKKGVTGTGGQESSLAGSIKPITSSGKDGVTLEVIIDAKSKAGKYYWYYVNDGRPPGKNPPIDPLIDWIKRKSLNAKKMLKSMEIKSRGISVKNKEKRKTIKELTFEQANKRLAIIISSKIGKRGTVKRFGYKGADFLNPVLKDSRVNELQKSISELIKRDIVLNIKIRDEKPII